MARQTGRAGRGLGRSLVEQMLCRRMELLLLGPLVAATQASSHIWRPHKLDVKRQLFPEGLLGSQPQQVLLHGLCMPAHPEEQCWQRAKWRPSSAWCTQLHSWCMHVQAGSWAFKTLSLSRARAQS